MSKIEKSYTRLGVYSSTVEVSLMTAINAVATAGNAPRKAGGSYPPTLMYRRPYRKANVDPVRLLRG